MSNSNSISSPDTLINVFQNLRKTHPFAVHELLEQESVFLDQETLTSIH